MFGSKFSKFIVSAIAWTCLVCGAGSAQPQSPAPVDYLGIPGPIEFAGTQYHFAWSARPSAGYVKHEYLPSGQSPASYTDMISIELNTAGVSLTDMVKAQTAMLDQRKRSDPLVNYQFLQNPANNQVVLDFIMSDESTGALIVEWDAYRYVSVAMPNGKNAVALFAISRRSYGDGARDFLKALKSKRTADIDALIRHAVPGVEASN